MDVLGDNVFSSRLCRGCSGLVGPGLDALCAECWEWITVAECRRFWRLCRRDPARALALVDGWLAARVGVPGPASTGAAR